MTKGSTSKYSQGHNFQVCDYKGRPTKCVICGDLLVGLVNQGLKCKNCGMDIHADCQKSIRMKCREAKENPMGRETKEKLRKGKHEKNRDNNTAQNDTSSSSFVDVSADKSQNLKESDEEQSILNQKMTSKRKRNRVWIGVAIALTVLVLIVAIVSAIKFATS